VRVYQHGKDSMLTHVISTSGMAEDAIVLLDHLGWTHKREVNVVGISLGGMIAQGKHYCLPQCCCTRLLKSSAQNLQQGSPSVYLPSFLRSLLQEVTRGTIYHPFVFSFFHKIAV
jgi:predicted alpha/beta-fold hydrolase